MNNKQGPGGRTEPNLGQKEAKSERAKKQSQPDPHYGYEEGKHTPQSEVMRKHRRVRP
jgi:hypothetical protein